VGNSLITADTGTSKPDYSEIFVLTQPVSGSYEFRPFVSFYRNIGTVNLFEK